jgi:PleD family two-component response regulator
MTDPNRSDPVKNSKILIVDDVPENIRMLIEILKDDHEIIPATSGEDALRKARLEPMPDLILLDIVMPGIDGYEVCKTLKEDEKTSNITVIFLTAISEVMDDAKAFDIGAVDFITKPFNPATVKARIKTQLKLKNTIDELKRALVEVKELSRLLPICASCKKIRDDKGYWNQIEKYLQEHSDITFSHSICPDCVVKLYPGLLQNTT